MGFDWFKRGTGYLPLHQPLEKSDESHDTTYASEILQSTIERKQNNQPRFSNSRWMPWTIVLVLAGSNLFAWIQVDHFQVKVPKDAVFCKFDWETRKSCKI